MDQRRSFHVAALSPVQWAVQAPEPMKVDLYAAFQGFQWFGNFPCQSGLKCALMDIPSFHSAQEAA